MCQMQLSTVKSEHSFLLDAILESKKKNKNFLSLILNAQFKLCFILTMAF